MSRGSTAVLPERGANTVVGGRHLDLSRLVWAVAALALAALVLVPLVWIFAGSLQSDANGQWTLGNYLEGFSKSIYLEPIRNSFVLASLVAVAAVIVGTLLAWATSRTDMPGRGLIRSLVFAAFVTDRKSVV